MTLFRHVASVAIVNSKNQILIQDRKGISKYGEEWSFFGGGIDENETALQAAVREIKEELILIIETRDLIHLGTFHHNFREKTYIRDLFIFRTELAESDFQIQEGFCCKYVPIELISNLKMITDMKEELLSIKKYLNANN